MSSAGGWTGPSGGSGGLNVATDRIPITASGASYTLSPTALAHTPKAILVVYVVLDGTGQAYLVDTYYNTPPLQLADISAPTMISYCWIDGSGKFNFLATMGMNTGANHIVVTYLY